MHQNYRNWAVLSDEQMSKGWPYSLLNDEQMSNWLGVEHQPGKLLVSKNFFKKSNGRVVASWVQFGTTRNG